MKAVRTFVTCGVLAAALVGGAEAQSTDQGRLYGQVTTVRGDVFEGYIRWDKNEGSWGDVLNGTKELDEQNGRDVERLADWEAREDRRNERGDGQIEILGLTISWNDDDQEHFPSSALSGIRFGHIRSLEVMGRDEVLLVLKSGEEVFLSGGSTDIGREIRGIVVEDPDRGEVELDWRDLDMVDFGVGSPREPSRVGERLYGTLVTRRGQEFTGWVAWDKDEILGSDVLDGEERGRDRRIDFERIASIERNGRSAARVTLHNGDEFLLRGTNDVNSSIRGIAIADPALGQVEVDWDTFDRLIFMDAPRDVDVYDDYDGGRSLRGTVTTDDGRELTGYIRWDNDEEYTWEILDGEGRGITYDIEFSKIAAIARDGMWGAEVTLLDGRVFTLEDSNDVDDDNKGIIVTFDNGRMELIEWWDFREVIFENP